MNIFSNYYLNLAIILFIYMSIWFLISILKKRNDIADIAWGLGFILMSWTSYFLSNSSNSVSLFSNVANLRSLLVNLLITIWGIRLASHIYARNKGKTEDYRYLAWRKEWGRLFYIRSYLQVYLLQGLFLYLIVFPVLFINNINHVNIDINVNSSFFSLFNILGFLIWIFGFVFESIGDYQLKVFLSDEKNKGKIIQEGLWRYTRHPNYFGEVTLWWGIYIFALSLENGYLTIFGPLTITILILFVSGIPLLEKKFEGRKDFEDYKRKTSVFIPFPPRS